MMDMSWRARDDLRTLSSAAEIGHDKKRMRAAQAEAKKQMKALQTVAGGKRGGAKNGPSDTQRRKRLEKVEL